MRTNRRRYLGMIVAAAGSLSIAGCSEDESDTDTGDVSGNGNGDTGGNGNGDQPDVEILNHEFFQEEFSEGVRGTAVNNTDSELSYVEVEVVFLDDSGTQIGDSLDNVTDLAAGREWEFECIYLDSDADRIESYEIEASTGF